MPYVAIPRSFVSETHVPEQRPTMQVHEDDRAPINTGLVDANGVAIYRVPETVTFGFVGRSS